MGNQVFKSEQYKQAVSSLSPEEMHLIKKQFAFLALRTPEHPDTVDKDTFLKYLPLPGMLGERMFSVCDRDHDNWINFEDFVLSVALLTHGTKDDRLKLIFQMYDVENKGVITRGELEMMFNSFRSIHSEDTPPSESTPIEASMSLDALDEQEAHDLAQRINEEIHGIDVKIEQAHGDSTSIPVLLDQKYQKERVLARLGRDALDEYREHGETLHKTVKKMADDALKACNATQAGKLTFEQFKEWALQNPIILDSVFESDGVLELRHRLSTRPSMRNYNTKQLPPKGVMYGYLYKAKRGGKLDRRFFLLQDRFLYEFKKEKDAMNEDKAPHRAIFMPGCHIFSDLYPSRSGSPTGSPQTEIERAISPPPLSLNRSSSRSSRSQSRQSVRDRDRARSQSRERIGAATGSRSSSRERLAGRSASNDHLATGASASGSDKPPRPPMIRSNTATSTSIHSANTSADHSPKEIVVPVPTSPTAVPEMRRISSSPTLKELEKQASARSASPASIVAGLENMTLDTSPRGADGGNRSTSPSPVLSPVSTLQRPKNTRSLTAPHAPVLLAPVDDWHVSQQQQPSKSSPRHHKEGKSGVAALLFNTGGFADHSSTTSSPDEQPSRGMRGRLPSVVYDLHGSGSQGDLASFVAGDHDEAHGSGELSKEHMHEIAIVYLETELLFYAEDRNAFEMWNKALQVAAQDKHYEDYYDILFDRPLGQGFFADVYYAESKGVDNHSEAGEEVACKIVYKEKMSEVQTEMFRSEIACLNLVRHPNIVSVYNIFDAPEKMYIFMELLEGGSVLSRLERDGFFRYDEGRDMVKQVCEGIRYLHDVGIVHRDIKPGNLVFSSEREDAVLKIVDFGLSTLASTADDLEKPVGTLKYFAPELITHKPYNREVDMWCVGVVAYMIMVAQFPFEARNQEDLLDNISQARYNTLSDNWRAVPDLARDFIRKLLVVDPEKRMTAEQACNHPWLSTKSTAEGRKSPKPSSNEIGRKDSKDIKKPKPMASRKPTGDL